MTEPTVGRIVHFYKHYDYPTPHAALVTAVRGGAVSLAVFSETVLSVEANVPHSDEPRPGHWTWPPKAEP